jgi:hypothetical protein
MVRHEQVQEQDLGGMLGNQLLDLPAILRFGQDLKIRHLLQNLADASAGHLVIICDQNCNSLLAGMHFDFCLLDI